MSKQYDALVIGSGTAGQTAAYELNRNGLTVGMVEHSQRPGGTCALSGCQAKKWFYEGVETVARSRHLSGIGITSAAVASWLELRDAKNRFTSQVPDNTVNGLKKAGIDLIWGRARFTDRHTISVDHQQLSARFIVLATGAVPMQLPIDGAQHMVTSSEFLELDRLPRRIIFIGGGFISFEFAHFAVRLGPTDTRCTILEAGPRPLGPFDGEMVGLLTEASAPEGIEILCDVKITAIEKTGDAFRVTTKDGRRFDADLVVHGAGRTPDLSDLDLEKAGIESTRRGITVNEEMVTSNAHVYAVGDCAATIQLARVADAEAQVAATGIVSRHTGDRHESSMDYTAVPSVLFTYPQYGMVGATEEALKEAGMVYKKSVGKNLTWPTYRRVGMKSAAYKVLADEKGTLLGAHVLSDNATGLINTCTLAMVNRIPVEALYRQSIMTPYPSRESDIIYMLKPLIA
ncbi:NAD(P)/FAD-dependent oxidoreductase [Desulfosarcina sp.]|uniref:dihydrolipoyl dehydrogenase family protein n=1 Tax=Desulfosarcina sp. TaxID=2027861 RepID=UPI0029A5F0DB|nr:NAD(P)/FAD-dependent oxidoreductase [Desulfosarcina sp.]MDX2452754.1 NAD(P)/FAD-dependent oxidoreductase [Desulfosarcina sp.]MDX2490505.1 NAD(P)/FAD-dependent oxidoreductase [Desulfosarcina sp.]